MTGTRPTIRFLVFSASLRQGSLNTALAALAAGTIAAKGERWTSRRWPSSTRRRSADVQAADGLPAGALELQRRLAVRDAFVICSPEYNASMPGVLKNVVDWVSRYQPQPFNEKHGLLMSASPSMVGGNRGLWALRVPFEHLGARIYPDMFSLAQAHRAFDGSGALADQALQDRFEMNVEACPRVRVVTVPGRVFFLPNEVPDRIADVIVQALAEA